MKLSWERRGILFHQVILVGLSLVICGLFSELSSPLILILSSPALSPGDHPLPLYTHIHYVLFLSLPFKDILPSNGLVGYGFSFFNFCLLFFLPLNAYSSFEFWCIKIIIFKSWLFFFYFKLVILLPFLVVMIILFVILSTF